MVCLSSAALYRFSGPGPFTLLCHTDMRKSHPLPDQPPGGHTGLQATHVAQLL